MTTHQHQPAPLFPPCEKVTKNALGSFAFYENNLNHTHYEYNLLGQVTRIHGDATNPVRYEFNTYGDMIKQTTYRDAQETLASVTTFERNEADGSLTSRTEIKNQNESHTVAYTYNLRGQIATMLSARGIKTTYGYDPDTGDLMSVSHNDNATIGTTYTRDRLGRVTSVTDATGTRQFTYRPTDLRLDHEHLGREKT